MRRPAYDSNLAFEGKIKSMRLISEMIGFGPMPAPDREVEQRLTLNSRGKIWFSNYLYGDGVKQKLHRKECSTISPTDADYILKLIAMVFTSPQSSTLVTDVGMWRLCLLSETGQNFKYEGSLTSQSENDPLGIASEELRKILSMPELAAFDGKVSEGQLSGKAAGQRPPSMQRFVREYTEACTHQRGDIANAKWGD